MIRKIALCLLIASSLQAAEKRVSKKSVPKPASFTQQPSHASAPPATVAVATNEERGTEYIVAVGGQIFVEQEDTESQYAFRFPILLRVGIGLRPGDILVEYSWFNVESSEGSAKVSRTQHIGLTWFRYALTATEGGSVRPFIGAAIGAQAERVKSTLGTQDVKSTGKIFLAGGVSTGISWVVAEYLELGADFRILASERFRPNPTVGAALTFGARF